MSDDPVDRLEPAISSLNIPEIREGIGAVCIFWSTLELQLELLHRTLEGSIVPGETITLTERSTERIKERIDGVQKAARVKLPPAAADKLCTQLGEIRTLSRERHRVAHGLWGIKPDGTIILVSQDMREGVQAMPVTAESLRLTKGAIFQATKRLRQWVTTLQAGERA